MELLILILHRGEYLEDILNGLVEAGISGATVVDSTGMMDILSHNVPVFAGLRALESEGGTRLSKMIFSANVSAETVDKAVQYLKDKAHEIHEPHLGVIMSIPMQRFSLLGHS